MVDLGKLKIPRVEPVDVKTLPIELPKIEIDKSKCTVPMWCKQCMQACSHVVFSAFCIQMQRAKESDPREPGVYDILPVRRDKCTLCGKCVEVCPEGAITVTYEDKVLKGVKTADTVEEAKKSSYPLWIAPQPYSFELNEEMLGLLRQEFDPEKTVTKFVEAIAGKKGAEIDEIAKEVFGEYGKQWMKRVLQFGEEYPDRTYEMLKEVVDHTGEPFPHIPQRFIETAYLSTQQLLKVNILENWSRRLVYQVPNCSTLRLIRDKCSSEVADLVPCKYACFSALETLFQDLDLNVTVDREDPTQENNYCQYTITSL